jgi:hypothetical protein
MMMMMMVMMITMMMMIRIIITIRIIVRHTDRCGNARREKCCAKRSGKEVKIQEFMYRDTTNVEPECTIIPEIIGATGIVTKS